VIKCEHCGATIDPGAYECPYCKAPTRLAAEARARQEQEAQARAQWDAQRGWQEQQVLGRQLESTAKQSLIFSILGLVTCCTPFGIMAVVQGFRARTMAQRIKAPVPGTGTAGLVIGFLGSVTSVVLIVIAMIQGHYDEQSAAERTTQLQKKVGDKANAAALDHTTACALAEIYALETGFDGHQGYSLDHFECIGKLRNAPDAAQLDTFRFRWSSSGKYAPNVCFKKGAKWYVAEMRKDDCPGVASP
jgi:hypothetical protein